MPTHSSDFMLKNPPQRTMSIIGDGLLPRGGKLLIVGETGVGKSVFAMDIAMSLVLAMPLFGAARKRKDKKKGAPFFPVHESCKVMYVDAELGSMGMYDRFSKLYERYEVSSLHDELQVTTNEPRLMLHNTMDSKGFDKLKDLVIEKDPDVLVIDPFIEFHQMDENSPAVHIPLTKLREIQDESDCSVILTHHASGKDFYTSKGVKVVKDDIDMARGHSSIVGWADTILVLTSSDVKTRCSINLSWPKCRRGEKPANGLCFADFSRMYVKWVTPTRGVGKGGLAAKEKKFIDTYNEKYPEKPDDEGDDIEL